MILEYPKVVYKHSNAAVIEFQEKYNEIQRVEFENKYGKNTYYKNENNTTITVHAKDESGKAVTRRLLREEHINLYQEYIRLYTRQIGQWNNTCSINNNMGAAVVNTLTPPSLRTNNVELSRRMKKVAESTIYRRTKRLIEAGLITKISHGSLKNYEIIFNPFLIFLQDHNNPENFSELSIDNAFKWLENANYKPNTGNLTRNLNKIIIETELQSNISNLQVTSQDTHKEFSTENSLLQVTKQDTSTGNTRKKAKIECNSKKKQKNVAPESSSAPEKANSQQLKANRNPHVDVLFAKIDQKLEKPHQNQQTYSQKIAQKAIVLQKLRIKFAALLAQNMIEGLLPNWKTYNDYLQRVTNYIAEHYLGNIQTYDGLESEIRRLNARLQIAIKHKTNHPEYKAPSPMVYFDIYNTKNGFINTKKMLKTAEKWLEIGKKRQNWQTDHQKLLEAVKRYTITPDYNTLEREKAYVNTNIPYFNKNFLKLALYPTDNQQSQTIN